MALSTSTFRLGLSHVCLLSIGLVPYFIFPTSLLSQPAEKVQVSVAKRKIPERDETILARVESSMAVVTDTIIVEIPVPLKFKNAQPPNGWSGPFQEIAEDGLTRRLSFRRSPDRHAGKGLKAYFAFSITGKLDQLFLQVKSKKKILFSDWVLVGEISVPNIRMWTDVLVFPPLLSPGDSVIATIRQPPLTDDTWMDGTWNLLADGTTQPGKYDSEYRYSQASGRHLAFRIPPDIKINSQMRINYIDPWGEKLFDLPLDVKVASASPSARRTAIMFTDDYGVPGSSFCLSGSFPNYNDLPQFKVGGQRLEIAAASSRSVIVILPDDISAHKSIMVSDVIDYDVQEHYEVRFQPIRLIEKLGPEILSHIRWTITVYGTDSKVPIILSNVQSPFRLTDLYGKPLSSRLLSSGGSSNAVSGLAAREALGPLRLEYLIPSTCLTPADVIKITDNNLSTPGQEKPIAWAPKLFLPPSPEEFRTIIDETRRQFRAGIKEGNLTLLVQEGKSYFLGDEIESAIQSVKYSLIDEFEGKDLLPLRDFIYKEVERFNFQLGESFEQGLLGAGVLKASYKPRNASLALIEKRQAISIFEQIEQFFSRLFNASEHLTITLCVVTLPEKANFTFYPASDRSVQKKISTNGSQPNVWIGSYLYRIERDGFEPVIDFPFDFIDDSAIALECPLVATGRKALACRPATEEGKVKCLRK